MKKTAIRFVSVSLLLAISFTLLTTPVIAANAKKQKDFDFFAAEYYESTVIDNVLYTFSYYYDFSGRRVIETFNSFDGRTDTIVYDESLSTITLNGKVAAEVTNTGVPHAKQYQPAQTRSGYVWIGNFSHYISWGIGTTANALVALLVAYLLIHFPITAVILIATVGLSVLNSIISTATCGTVYGDTYVFEPYLDPMQWKASWNFLPQGMNPIGWKNHYWTS
jgi:hypothetical protein